MAFSSLDNEQDTLRTFVNNVQTVLGDTPAKQTAITDLGQTISGTYSQSEVQAISDKVDEILAMLRLSGILDT